MHWLLNALVVSVSNSTSNHNPAEVAETLRKLFQFLILHQTTTDDYIKFIRLGLFQFLILHQTTTRSGETDNTGALFQFLILHQTTTIFLSISLAMGCFSF